MDFYSFDENKPILSAMQTAKALVTKSFSLENCDSKYILLDKTEKNLI